MGQMLSLCGNAVDLENGDERINVRESASAVWTEGSSSSTGSVTPTSRSSSSSLSIEKAEACLDVCQWKQLDVRRVCQRDRRLALSSSFPSKFLKLPFLLDRPIVPGQRLGFLELLRFLSLILKGVQSLTIISLTSTHPLDSSSPRMTNSSPECRICFCEGSKLISPCACKGSCAFVHDHCLKKWVQTSGQMTCPSCNEAYSGENKPKRLTRWRLPLTFEFLCFLTVSLAYLILILACLYFHTKFSQYLPLSISLVLYIYEVFNLVGLTYTSYRAAKEIWQHNQEFVFVEKKTETIV